MPGAPLLTTSRLADSNTRKGLPARLPTIGLALGGGGARGLAHALMLEAFDELGLRPKVIAGTSIGAIYGAAYASGLSGKELRTHTEELLDLRIGLVRELFQARAKSFTMLWGLVPARTALLDAQALLDIVMPPRTAQDFSQLGIPLKVIATDFYAQEPKIFTLGSLRRAVAASMALPVVFEPVVVDGRALLDGGLVNPLPFDLLTGEADIIVAIDVSSAPIPAPGRDHPSAYEALVSSAFIFERSLVREKLRNRQPDIYIDAGTSQFATLDFLRAKDILAAAEPAKQKLKAQLSRVLGAETVPAIEPPSDRLDEALPSMRRRLERGPSADLTED